MVALIDPVFAKALETGRERFNALFMQARRDFPKLDAKRVLDFLASDINEFVAAVSHPDPRCVHATVEAIYEATLTLLGKCVIGPDARHAEFESLWMKLLTAHAQLIARFPRELVTDLTNALYNMISTPRCRAADWCSLMTSACRDCGELEQVRSVGVVAAWMCGMAYYRETAIGKASTLPDAIVRRLFNVAGEQFARRETMARQATIVGQAIADSRAKRPGGSDEPTLQLLDRLAADPWYLPNGQSLSGLSIVAEVGGFRGLGAEFLRPPQIAVHQGRFYVSDGESCWQLSADIFGATFRRTIDALPKSERGGKYRIERSGLVTGPRSKSTFSLLAGSSSSASTDSTLAVTLPHSHYIFLISEGKP